MFASVTVTSVVEMMFQPSRSLAVSMVRWSETTFLQPLTSAAKWPPRRRVRPSPRRSPSQRVSEMILSASPGFGLPVIRPPAPSMTPPPTKPMFVSLSP